MGWEGRILGLGLCLPPGLLPPRGGAEQHVDLHGCRRLRAGAAKGGVGQVQWLPLLPRAGECTAMAT